MLMETYPVEEFPNTRNVFVQGLVVDELRLELAASFVAGAAENDGSLVWGAKERLERVGA